MLVLSRKTFEEVIIGDNIVVRVCSISGNRVSLGIEAPGQPINRAELLIEKKPQGADARGLKLVRGHGNGGLTPPSPRGSGKAA